MTDFFTDLLWEEEKHPAPPLPGRPHEHQHDKPVGHPTPVAKAESHAERLQRVAGNGALARDAEEAAATRHRLAQAAQHPATVTPKPAARKPEAAKPEKKPAPASHAKAAERPAAAVAVKNEAERLPQAVKAAAVRAAALAQVLASFETDPARAELLTLAHLVENAPPGIAEDTARALARAVMRADPAHRAAIAARIRTQLGDHRDLRLARLLADRLAGLATTPARASAPAAPPPAE